LAPMTQLPRARSRYLAARGRPRSTFLQQ
jgi:hypothetical protein